MDDAHDQPVPSSHAETLTLIPGYGTAGELPTVEGAGGETTVVTNPPHELEPDVLYERVLALCASWADLTDRAGVTNWLESAVPLLGIEGLIDFNNVVLTSPAALGDLADVLAKIWEVISADDGSRGNVALEGWTRLALAGWTESLPIRAALGKRAARAAQAHAQADGFLVRSLGAVLDQWPDAESRNSLERLAVIEEVECNVAFELGMALLRQAVSVDDLADAAGVFAAAYDMFNRANLEGERPDAVAFGTASSAVGAFLIGQPVAEETISKVQGAITEWYNGYLGLVPEWRQARAQTAGAWAALLTDLGKLSDLDRPWLDATRLLADVGHLYSAHNSMIMVADPRKLPSLFGDILPLPVAPDADRVDHPVGIPVAVSPRLDAALVRTADSLELVDRWLDAMTQRLPDDVEEAAVDAINRARERIRSAPPTGKAGASRESLIPEEIREALSERLDEAELALVEHTLGPLLTPADATIVRAGITDDRPVPLAEELTLAGITAQLSALLPDEFDIWGPRVTQVLRAVIRVVTIAIDREQGGARNLPWHRDPDERKPPEAELADYLALGIQLATGNRCHVEVHNTGGGRADVLIPIGTEQFVIEVKRITAKRTNDALTTEYGPQATEYTKTGAPFAFLAVLDLTRHASRLDLADSFWVDEWHDDSGRTRALTGLRVLGKVDPPSSKS
ncbi:hypothetical protein [Actinopolymorpha alba]|uniref:hypothetical protein n=1 Tax=Actinopolymorpha alba TaxID=533267 RepID=UPI000365C1F4|nr:hypothetical protein [Actinopolymorpha alba]